MNQHESQSGLSARLAAIHDALEGYYGRQSWHPEGDPLEQLIGTVLSQHTSDVNAERAYQDLRRQLGSWERIAAQPAERIAQAIRAGGLANSKAPRIQAILRSLAESPRGLDLEFLRQLPLDDAREFLTRLHGVGLKTASCVLLFSLGLPAFPVDTHVHRVLRRLGIVSKSTSADDTTRMVEAAVPPERRYSLHMLLIRHGRALCRARRPDCLRCALLGMCPTGQAHVGADARGVAARS